MYPTHMPKVLIQHIYYYYSTGISNMYIASAQHIYPTHVFGIQHACIVFPNIYVYVTQHVLPNTCVITQHIWTYMLGVMCWMTNICVACRDTYVLGHFPYVLGLFRVTQHICFESFPTHIPNTYGSNVVQHICPTHVLPNTYVTQHIYFVLQHIYTP